MRRFGDERRGGRARGDVALVQMLSIARVHAARHIDTGCLSLNENATRLGTGKGVGNGPKGRLANRPRANAPTGARGTGHGEGEGEGLTHGTA